MDTVDAVVIGSGPNGLVAAATLARAGWSVTVVERSDRAGGAVRTDALTAPGYLHDTASAFYGVMHASLAFKELGLHRRVDWVKFDTAAAAVTDDDVAALCHADPAATIRGLDERSPGDGQAWKELWDWWMGPGQDFFTTMVSPLGRVRPPLRFLRRSGIRGALDATRMLLTPVADLARERFTAEASRILVASAISHSDLGADATASTPTALMLGMIGQQYNFPIPVGGAGRLAEAIVDVITEGGGSVITGADVTRVVIENGRAVGVETADGQVIRARRAVLADTGPGKLTFGLVGEDAWPDRWLAGVRRFRYGTGMFRIDLALDGPVQWSAPGLDRTGVIHLLGSIDQMVLAAGQSRSGHIPTSPMLIVGQQTLADPSRAPAGCHTLWIETHVPPKPVGDSAGQIEVSGGQWGPAVPAFFERVLDRIERHAPDLRSRIVGTNCQSPADLEARNPNVVGGDVAGGATSLDQLLVFRPVLGWFRYRTPIKGLYLCSASTHPGGGVHGMCGRNAAERVIADRRRRTI